MTVDSLQFAFYRLVKGEDEILYPGYHVRLLDEASETYIYQTREDLMKCLEVQLAEIGLEPSQVLKVCVTTILILVIIHFFANIYVSTVFVHPCYLIYSVICGDSWKRRGPDWRNRSN